MPSGSKATLATSLRCHSSGLRLRSKDVRRHLPAIAGPPRNGRHRPACSAAETTKSWLLPARLVRDHARACLAHHPTTSWDIVGRDNPRKRRADSPAPAAVTKDSDGAKSPTAIDGIRPRNQVRTGLAAGGRRIRTAGPPWKEKASFETAGRPPAPSPSRESSVLPPACITCAYKREVSKASPIVAGDRG